MKCPRPLNTGVRLIKLSFKENKGNKFGDFGYCPLNTGFTVSGGEGTWVFFWVGMFRQGLQIGIREKVRHFLIWPGIAGSRLQDSSVAGSRFQDSSAVMQLKVMRKTRVAC